MKNTQYLFLITLFTLSFGKAFSQTADSLSVFPNPFSNSATIYFQIVQADTITLKVFNMTGQPMKTFFEETVLPSGSYNINLLGDGLVNGVYLVVLEIGTTKKIVRRVVKNDDVAGVSDNKLDGKLLIYPNPTKDQFTIPIPGNKTILITDLNGKTVKYLTTDEQVISLIDIKSGQYVINILTNQNEVISKQSLIKLR